MAIDVDEGDAEEPGRKGTIVVRSYLRPAPGPYPEDQPKMNSIRFTEMQVEAIKSGLHHGLTQIVGPPGTGKTDTAVQIMSELFHNFPGQRTLLVTHSNHALNDLFEKIMERDIDERHLLRCGRGEEELKTNKDFSKFGRVNYMLERRLECLDEVARLATSLGLPDDVAYSCETSGLFFLQSVLSQWELFVSHWEAYKKDGSRPKNLPAWRMIPEYDKDDDKKSKPEDGGEEQIEEIEEDDEDKSAPEKQKRSRRDVEGLNFVEAYFPFTPFFENTPAPLFKPGASEEKHMENAHGGWHHLEHLFEELEECRPFEVLRNYQDRGTFLITKHAKVIAMTCT